MKLKQFVKSCTYAVASPFCDIFTDAPAAVRHPLSKKIGLTWRYRLAALNIVLTENERRLASFHNKHQGARCFIIGNGPSLNDLDLSLLKDEFTFGTNAIYLNRERMGFSPTYYVVEDTFVAEDRAEEIVALGGTTKFVGNHLDYCLDRRGDFIWLNVIFRYDRYSNFPNFSKNCLRRIWVGGTVSYLCMQLAYYMGFREVYLIGFDHKYVVPSDALVSGSEILSVSDDVNHFTGAYFGAGKRWHDPFVDRMELAYAAALREFTRANRTIANATVGGRLEVFPRVDYGKLFSGVAPKPGVSGND